MTDVPIGHAIVKSVAAELYARALRQVPGETQAALRHLATAESNPTARRTIAIQLESAAEAQAQQTFVCSDAGIPVYVVRIGTGVRLQGDIRRAFVDGFASLIATSDPPLLPHVTDPLTGERSHAGRGMPVVTFDLIDGADYLEIICSPSALGSGRWAALEVFSFPSLATIERYVLEVVLRAGAQPCPPVVIGVGIGGTFDYAAKMAKEAMLRPFGQRHPEPMVAAMERRLLAAVNQTGFGPMGTGGDGTAMELHVEYSAGHGYTPVAVSFNCWINRRAGARIFADGHTEYF
ncbi:MAG: fumarate hydratase [Gammaproteobacteria bacterium]|nr:fumarate hydratase [Gammaproteobacteria bacterium]